MPLKIISTQHYVIWHCFYQCHDQEQGKNSTRLKVGRICFWDASTFYTEGAGFFAQDDSVNWVTSKPSYFISSPWYFSYSSQADGQFPNLSQLLLSLMFRFFWLHNSEIYTTVTGIYNFVHFLNKLSSVLPWTATNWTEHTFPKNFLIEECLKTGFWTRLGKWISSH